MSRATTFTFLLFVARLAYGADAPAPMAVGRDLVLVVEQTEPPMVRVSVDVDGRAIAERAQTPFVFLLKGHDLGEGAHLLCVRGGAAAEGRQLGSVQVSVVPDCLDVTRSLCVLVSKGEVRWTPPTAQLLAALGNSTEPLRLLARGCAQIGDQRELWDVRGLLEKELEAWAGAVFMLAQRLASAKPPRAIELLVAFTEVDAETSLTPKALQLLAQLCDASGQYDRGIAACRRLLEKYPDNEFAGADALLRMAYCLDHSGRRSEGIELLEQAVREHADSNPRAAAVAKADLAFTRDFLLGDLPEAIRLTRQALTVLPRGDPARITLQARIGMYYSGLKDYGQALVEYGQVPPGRGTDPSWAYDCRVFVPAGMARALDQLGRATEARQVLEHATERYADDEWVVRRLRLELRRYHKRGGLADE
ncbi:MAG: hypothetical protein CO096_01765 [Armatimonadetes bacterium CG_4_9_14_3_um_filter_66_14]|nr:MAG: hypothetical protein CO096_01765 [Armatimonadetes bacterium CG_4_9_14_3_um_filter_66_14]